MKNFFKVAKVSLMIMMCALFLGIGIKAEAALGKVAGVTQIADDVDEKNPGKYAVGIQWTALPGAEAYLVEYCESGKNFIGTTYQYGLAAKNSVVIPGLSGGMSYDVKVSAVTLAGKEIADQGAPSDVVDVVTAPSGTVTTLKQSGAQAKKVTVSWTKIPGANVYDIGYKKYGSTAKAQYVTTPNDVSSYSFSAAADTNYIVCRRRLPK